MTFLTENLRHSYQSLEVKSKYIPYLSTLISWQKNVFQHFLILCLFSLTVRILLEVIKSIYSLINLFLTKADKRNIHRIEYQHFFVVSFRMILLNCFKFPREHSGRWSWPYLCKCNTSYNYIHTKLEYHSSSKNVRKIWTEYLYGVEKSLETDRLILIQVFTLHSTLELVMW